MDCLFCKIARKEIPAKIAYEDESVIAFHDINPQAPVHILLIPKIHFDSLAATNQPEYLTALFKAVHKIASDLKIESYRIVINNGPDAGQTVFHLHVHLLSGRPMLWPPG